MIRCLLLISLLINASLARKLQPAEPQAPVKNWPTLSGNIFSSLFFFLCKDIIIIHREEKKDIIMAFCLVSR